MEKNFYFDIAYDTFFVASTSKINIQCAQFFIFFSRSFDDHSVPKPGTTMH